MPEGLRLIVDAETRPAVNALKDLERQARKSGLAAGQSFGASSIKGATGLKSLTSSSNAATISLTNLGRVVQDAPFGFLGIANNLNPLLESFQRLKTTTGSSTSALSALGKSLIGPAGIGIALSVVSSLLIVFGDKLFGASKAAKEAKEATDELAKSAAQDIVKLTSLAAVASNVNKSYEERSKAIKAINQDYGKYLDSMGKEQVTAENIAKSYDKIIDSMLRQAVVKGLQEEIEKVVQKTAASIISLEQTEAKRRLSIEKTQKAEKKQVDGLGSMEMAMRDVNQARTDGFLAQSRASQQLQAEIKNANTYEVVLARLKDTLKKDLEPLFKIMGDFSFEDLKIKLNDSSINSTDKTIEELIRKAKALANELQNIFVVPSFSAADSKEQTLAKARKFLDDFFNARLVVKMPIKVSLDDVQFPPEEVKQLATSFEDMFSKELKAMRGGETIDFSLIDAQTAEKQKKLIAGIFGITPSGESPFTAMQRESIAAAKAISDVLTPAFQGLFTAILSGENPIKSFFQSLGQSVQQLISKLVAAAVQALILSAIFPGGLGGVKGFGKMFTKILGFASGGIVSGPTLAMIGEGIGTSRSNPEVVAPLDQLQKMLDAGGGRTQTVIVKGELRNRTIKLGQARESRTQRNTVGR